MRLFPLSLHSSVSPLVLCVAMNMPLFAFAAEGQTDFDLDVLKARGIDPKVAEWFREAPRFTPEKSTVELTVNGNARGKLKAQFDQNGQLCVNQALAKQAGLLILNKLKSETDCFDLKSVWFQTEINLDPSSARVDIVVPQAAVGDTEVKANWKHGGFAGLLNYNAQYMATSGSATGVDFMQLSTEAGFNLGDWIVRSRQTVSNLNGENHVDHHLAYAQRTFAPIEKVFQVGQISLSNSMFGTGQVIGFQVFPETALQNNSNSQALVEGIADTQSVVEVRQSGVLMHTTTVPAGRFRLQGFPLLNSRSDLVVTVTGSNGDKRQFVVPASALPKAGQTVVPGLSFGMGRLDQAGSAESPLVATISNGWQLTPYSSLNAGLLGSSPWQAGSVSIDSQLWDETRLSLQSTLAQDKRHTRKGISNSMTLSHNLTERVGVNLNAIQQSSGYRELSDALQKDEQENTGYIRNQVGGGISWSSKTLGSFSLAWAHSRTFDHDRVRYMSGSWGKNIGQAYVSANVDYNTGGKNNDADHRFYLTLSLPLGKNRNVNTYLNNTSRGSRTGIRFSDQLSQDRNWSIASEHDFEGRHSSLTTTTNMITPLSQLSGSISTDSDHYTTWSGQASGSIVAHDDGIAISPYRVGDTFGVARVGNEKRVRLDTPAGPTWTNAKGYAVLPSLNSYNRSTIQVDTRSLGKNIDIANAWQETEAARGSVNYVEFEVVRTRRVLVGVKDANQLPLPHGASVFDANSHFVTVVGDQGSVFIPDVSTLNKMDVQYGGKTLCSFTLSMPEQADSSGLYETADAVCQ